MLVDMDDDLKTFSTALTEREIQTVFIGGGTPSLFSSDNYRKLFTGLRERLRFSDDAEITLEANPGSSEADKFAGFREAGINRLSIGVQSFNQKHLSKLGRVHNAKEAIAAAAHARQAGFTNFNLDLMFGLPEQDIDQAIADLKQAINLEPSHLSCYQLTIEPNTLFHHNPPVTPDDEALWDMQEALQEQLSAAGYKQYEVSAYAKQSRQCKHNLNYWNFGDYIGIGAGAHGKITCESGIHRTWKVKHPNSYLKQPRKMGGTNEIVGNNISFEYMLNALRLNKGFDLHDFENRTGQSRDSIDDLLSKHQDLNLISLNNSMVVPTQFGHNMLNSMLEDYLEKAQQ